MALINSNLGLRFTFLNKKNSIMLLGTVININYELLDYNSDILKLGYYQMYTLPLKLVTVLFRTSEENHTSRE